MSIALDMKSRNYDMSARQEAKDATRYAIINAAIDTFMAERTLAITLPSVAQRANRSRRSRDTSVAGRRSLTSWSQVFDDVMAERVPPPDDPEALSEDPSGMFLSSYSELRWTA